MAKKIVRLTESDMNRLIKKILSEQDPTSTKPTTSTQPTTSTKPTTPTNGGFNLPDCFEYIRRTSENVVSGPRPGDTGSRDRITGGSKIIRGLDIEYFTDGGPDNTAIFLSKNGKRICATPNIARGSQGYTPGWG